MANDDKSTRILGSADIQKTRLVRREPSTPEPSRTAPVTDEPKTRMAFRPQQDGAPTKAAAAADEDLRLVAGWLVVIDGPGRGKFAAVYDGMNSLGRGADQATQLNFGDETISRSEHAFVTYDHKDRKFYLQHGGKASIVRLNGQPVLQPSQMKSGDTIFVGSTTLRFVAMCGDIFDWKDIGF
jgi:pSer/pThr/pTyr-binding forkhead associated (FHA) protein